MDTIPDLDITALPSDQGSLDDLDDFGITLEPEDPMALAEFHDLDENRKGRI